MDVETMVMVAQLVENVDVGVYTGATYLTEDPHILLTATTGNSDDGVTALVEDCLLHSTLVLCRGVEGRIVFTSLLAVR